jgi:hypothetical protein
MKTDFITAPDLVVTGSRRDMASGRTDRHGELGMSWLMRGRKSTPWRTKTSLRGLRAETEEAERMIDVIGDDDLCTISYRYNQLLP